MKLKSFGCSFVYGSDLPDCSNIFDQTHPGHSRLTWPCLLAHRLNLPYECYAWPGVGNLKILERILNEAYKSDPAIFVISWTWIDRWDYILHHTKPWVNASWSAIRPNDDSYFAEKYYREYHSQIKDQLCNVLYVTQAIQTLEQAEVPYIMTCLDDLLIEDLYHNHPAIEDLQAKIKTNLNYFQNQTFVEWSRSNGFPISSGLHPLTQAHEAAAHYVAENWLSPQIREFANG